MPVPLTRSVGGVPSTRVGRTRFIAALVFPFVVLVVQWLAWPVLQPFSWFLFVAGVFLSSWMGGLRAGIVTTFTSAVLVWFFFLAPALTFVKLSPSYFLSAALFILLGVLFSFFHERLRRAQRDSRASEAKFAGILASAFDAIISVDEQQQIVLYNRAAAELFGYTRDEVLGKPLTMLMPERFRARHPEHIRRFAASPELARLMSERPAAIFGERKNGEEFPAEGSVSKLEVDGQRLFTVVLRDVTVQRRLEREQKFLASIGEMFATSLDPSETLTRVTQSSVEFFGDFLILDLLEEGTLRRAKVAHADPAQAGVAKALESLPLDQFQPPPVRDAIETKQTQIWREPVSEEMLRSHIPEAHVRALVNAMHPQSTMYVPLIVRDAAIGVMTFVSSKPARHYAASDVRLAEEVARRAALALENSHLYKTARDAIEARDEILGVVAHDLRNPLNTIQLSARLIRNGLSEESRQRLEGSVDAIVRSSQRANRLIQDLLEVRRAQVGRLTLERDAVSAARLLLDLVEGQRPLFSVAKLELQLELPPALPALWADRDRILQVFENLLGNALKFTPGGGHVSIGARHDGNRVVFFVRDTGPGMPSEELSHMFDRFWQSQDRDRRGMGLGLAIAKQVVEAHGGEIWAESQIGRGTTFFFTIPTTASPGADLVAHASHA